MKVTYDKQADAMYISLFKGKVKRTVEVNPRVIVDVDARGRTLGIELLFVSEKIPKSELRSFSKRVPTTV